MVDNACMNSWMVLKFPWNSHDVLQIKCGTYGPKSLLYSVTSSHYKSKILFVTPQLIWNNDQNQEREKGGGPVETIDRERERGAIAILIALLNPNCLGFLLIASLFCCVIAAINSSTSQVVFQVDRALLLRLPFSFSWGIFQIYGKNRWIYPRVIVFLFGIFKYY